MSKPILSCKLCEVCAGRKLCEYLATVDSVEKFDCNTIFRLLGKMIDDCCTDEEEN